MNVQGNHPQGTLLCMTLTSLMPGDRFASNANALTSSWCHWTMSLVCGVAINVLCLPWWSHRFPCWLLQRVCACLLAMHISDCGHVYQHISMFDLFTTWPLHDYQVHYTCRLMWHKSEASSSALLNLTELGEIIFWWNGVKPFEFLQLWRCTTRRGIFRNWSVAFDLYQSFLRWNFTALQLGPQFCAFCEVWLTIFFGKIIVWDQRPWLEFGVTACLLCLFATACMKITFKQTYCFPACSQEFPSISDQWGTSELKLFTASVLVPPFQDVALASETVRSFMTLL